MQTRRSFLAALAAALASPSVLRAAELKFGNAEIKIGAEKPFSILHLSDSHIALVDDVGGKPSPRNAAGRHKMYSGNLDTLKASLAWARERHLPVFHTGDLIDYVCENNLAVAREWRTLAPEGLLAAGNHEFCQWGGNPVDENAAYKSQTFDKVQAAFPDDLVFSSKILNGVNFVAFDNVYYFVPPSVPGLFEKEVRKGLPIVLLCHVPFYTPELWQAATKGKRVPCSYLRSVPWDKVDAYTDTKRIREQRSDKLTMDFTERLRAEPLVKSVLCGHLHWGHVSRFSPTALQRVVPANLSGGGCAVSFV